MHGIDTPEKAPAFGTRARQFAIELAFRQTVTVRMHDTDRYGRLVAEVILPNGRSLGHELVEAGMAWWYKRYPQTIRHWRNSKPRRRRRSVGDGAIRTPWHRARSGGTERWVSDGDASGQDDERHPSRVSGGATGKHDLFAA